MDAERERITALVLAAIQAELQRQGRSPDYPGASAAVGAPERAALAGVFDLEEVADAVCLALVRGTAAAPDA